MAASISSVTTMGYGNGTFSGTIPLVVTLGYGIGAAAAAATPVEGWVACRLNRVAVANSVSRVVWAKPQGK